MLFRSERVSFGVDGKVRFVYPNPGTGRREWPFDAPHYLILNIAVGGGLGGPVDDTIFPLRLEIEHVRVYQRALAATGAGR